MSRNSILFSHLDFVSLFWAKAITSNSTVIDATCGNGKDTLRLMNLMKGNPSSHLVAIDIQKEAIEKTKQLLSQHQEENSPKLSLIHSSHEAFPTDLKNEWVSLIIYNLGYLPGADKDFTTLSETTLLSLKNALELLRPNGLISITCYPGHNEGKEEENHLSTFVSELMLSQFDVIWYKRLNRPLAPSVILIHKLM